GDTAMFKKMLVAVVVGMGLLAAAGTARAEKSEVQKLFDKYSELRDAKKYTEAIAALDEVIKLDPKNPYSWSEGAWVFNEMQKHGESGKFGLAREDREDKGAEQAKAKAQTVAKRMD